MSIKAHILFLALIASPICSIFSQTKPNIDSLKSKPRVCLELGWQELYSTHSNFFHGFNAEILKQKSAKFAYGLGAEYSFSPFHNDNGWKLYKLHFFPVYAIQKINLTSQKKVNSYLKFKEGLSFVNYTKEEKQKTPYHVSEKGVYISTALGINKNINYKTAVYIETGFKAFHMSFYDLEVNPHGVFFSTGITLH
jgi:hypothetical protein